MASDVWRWADPDGQQRRVRLDELRAALADGVIAPNTPVWRSGWKEWQPAHEVPELTSASMGGANGVVLNIPPPPLAMVAVQQEYEAASDSLAPVPPRRAETEPPPPPRYVPVPAKSSGDKLLPSSGHLKTQLGGSVQGLVAPAAAPAAAAQAPAPHLPSSLPTTIGVPVPPQLAAMAAAARSRPSSRPPPPPAAKAGSERIEEISGSMLVDSPSGQMPAHDAHGPNVPAPTDAMESPVFGDPSHDEGLDDNPALPRRFDFKVVLDDIAAIRARRPPKHKALLAGLGMAALSLLVLVGAAVGSCIAGSPSSSSTPTAKNAPASSAAAAAGASAAPRGAPTAATPAGAGAPAPVLGDCTTSGDEKTIAPRAVIPSGIEASAGAGSLAFGFAPTPRDAVATALDPSSLAPTSTVRAHPVGADVRRVTPLFVSGKLTAIPDVDRKGDRLAGRRIVAANTLIDVGSAEGALVWAPHARDSFANLFSLEGDAPVEALRAVALTDRKGIAITFRRGNAIHVGVAKGDSVLEPEGELSRIAGLGQVGSPALAASGDSVVVAWADRAGASDDWGLRWAKVRIGASTQEATPFTIPEGGLGGQAMSPSIAPLGGGRFLLAWTEGPVSSHQVRAITITADGSPSGSALAISAPGVNAGQPAAVVGPDGHGAVAFLAAAKGKALEVRVRPISCPPR